MDATTLDRRSRTQFRSTFAPGFRPIAARSDPPFQEAPGERMVLRLSAEPGRQSCSSGQPDYCCSARWRFPPPGPHKPPPLHRITRTVVAATKLPTVTDVPLHFKAVSVTLQPDQKSDVSAANGILYQMSGSTEVSLGGEAKMLNAGEGLFIAGGKTVALTAGSGEPSTFLHFFLVPAVDLGRPVETAPAAVRELYRTATPIPG